MFRTYRARVGGVWLRTRVVFFAAATFCSMAAVADISVPAGGVISLNGGSVDLACSDVIVAGTLSLQGGSLTNVRHVSIAAGGSIVAGSGSITLAGDWSNLGSFGAGTGAVNFVDAPACVATSTISGNSTFATLSLISTTGKLYRFAAGSTQNVTQQLTISGTQALPIRIESGTAGQRAFINLSGQQTMNQLAVTDMTASGRWIAPYLNNRNPNGAVTGWFGDPEAGRVVPALSTGLLLGLSALLLLSGVGVRRWANVCGRISRRASPSNTRNVQD